MLRGAFAAPLREGGALPPPAAAPAPCERDSLIFSLRRRATLRITETHTPSTPPVDPHLPPYPPRLSAQVRALEKDPVDARLFELVDIFSHGSLDAYTSYYSRNNAYLKELGVDHEKSVETMRLLTLCSLASANHVASYDVIESALQVSALLPSLPLSCL